MLHELLVATWVVGMVALLAAALTQYAMYRRIRSAHVSVWEELGRPSVARYNEYLASMNRLTWRRKYADLGDKVLSRLRLSIKIFLGLAILGVLSAVVLAWVPLSRS